MKRYGAVCLLLSAFSLGCGSTPHEQGQYGAAGAATILNSVAWTTGGCRISECNPGWECNESTRRCERIPCSGRCSSRDLCDEELDECLEPPLNASPGSGI